MAYGAPDPSAPEGIGNLGNFIYVGTGTWPDLRLPRRLAATGEQQLAQHLPRSGWLVRRVDHHRPHPRQPRSLRCNQHRCVLQCRLDPPGGQPHQRQRRVGQPHRQPQEHLPYTIFSQSYNPTTDPNATKYNQAARADLHHGRLAIRHPQQRRPTLSVPRVSTPCWHVGRDSGVYMSTASQQWPDMVPLPRYDLWRGRGGGLSASRRGHQPEPVDRQHRQKHRHGQPGQVRTIRIRPRPRPTPTF